jgi:hypothetical protein
MPTNLRPIWVMLLGWFLFGLASTVSARPLGEARLTHVFREVFLAHPHSSSAPASLHTPLRDGVVWTGIDSRAELTFPDQTVARLGDNTELVLNSKKRTLELLAGAVLAQVPKGVGGTQLAAADITAVVTGTTVLLEHHASAYIKCIVLDGTVRLCLKKPGHTRDFVLLRAGQMLIANPAANALPDVVDVDLDRLNQTCRLITDFPVLPRQDLLSKAAAKQRSLKWRGVYAETNLVIFGRGTLVNLTDSDADVRKNGGTVSPPNSPP